MGASWCFWPRQEAVYTIFADGEPRVKPLLIFKGKSKQISFREKVCLLLGAAEKTITFHPFSCGMTDE